MLHTRNTDYLTLENRRVNTTTASKSFIPRSVTQWNSLPLGLREIRDPNTFKTSLRKYVKDTVPVK